MDLRETICAVGKQMYDRGYTAANDGNISVRTGENEVWMTPSGVSKGRMTPEMLVKLDLDGNILDGERYPSSESKLHLAVYRRRSDVGAVVHAHPPVATAFAVCHRALDRKFLAELVLGLDGEVPVAPYATPSTEEVPDSIEPFLPHYNAVLLANHGVVTWGGDIWSAFDRLETVEHTAKIYQNVKLLNGGRELSKTQVTDLMELEQHYRRLSGNRGD